MPTTINLNNCFPEPVDPEKPRGPLPKQAQFMGAALKGRNPKYIRYVGGIGSGKSLIGCITVLSWAVQYPGDYLIARQFYPELKDTTMQTFLDICPPELIKKREIANNVVYIQGANGVSRILFRPLVEPDKLRSLNLNGFYIDEANQVSEAAFTLLQGRLRGRHVRKGILTQNSGGHDWSWRWFVKQDMHKTSESKNAFLNIVAPSTENIHLPEGYVQMMMDTWSEERIAREILADEDSFEGQVYPEFKQNIHVIPPFAIPDDWVRVVGADHGFRNPAAWVWGAVDPDGDIYIYREFYQREWTIPEIMEGKRDDKSGEWQKGVVGLSKGENIEMIYMDPNAAAQKGRKTGTEMDEYREYAPKTWAIVKANNKKEPGIDRVKQYLKVDERTRRPRLFVFNTCNNLIDEVVTYRWAELPVGQQGRQNEREEPVKYHDHACDALRYLIMSRPEPAAEELAWYEEHNIEFNSKEGRLHRELEEVRGGGKEPDNWGSGDF